MHPILTLALSLFVSLGAEVPLGTPLLKPAVGGQSLDNVASNGRDFLAVWEDTRIHYPTATQPFSYPALFAGRVGADGRPLEPTGHRIVDAANGRVFWDGHQYLLLYVAIGTSGVLQPLDDDGRPAGKSTQMDLPGPPRSFATNGRNLLVDANGLVWLMSFDGSVLWKEFIGNETDASEIAVLPNGDYRFAALVNGRAIVATFDGTTGIISTRTLVPGGVGRIGAAGNLVAWTEGAVAKYALIDGGAPVQIASDAAGAEVAVGWDGHQYAVVLATPDLLRMTRVAADGRQRDAAPIELRGGPRQHIHFATSATDVLLAGDRSNGGDNDVVALASHSFDDIAAAQLNVLASSAAMQDRPLVAEGGLTFWIEEGALKAQYPGGAQHVVDASAPLIGVGRGQTSYLAAWITPEADFRDGDLVAKRVAFDGTPIDSDPIALSVAKDVFFGYTDAIPAIAFDGTNYLVVWPDILGDLHAVRVAQDAHPIDAQPIAVTNFGGNSGYAVTPRVVWTGSTFVVAWADQFYSSLAISPAPPQPAFVDIVRITSAGQVLDAKPAQVWTKSEVSSVGLATNGGNVELLFAARTELNSRTVCIYRDELRNDGTPSATPRPIACSDQSPYTGPLTDLGVAWDGDEYVSVWSDPATALVNAMRLDVDDAPVAVATVASEPSIASSPAGATIAYVRVADEPRFGSVPRVFARRLVVQPRRRTVR